MKRYGHLAILLFGLMVVLSACVGQTALVFANQTSCGTIHIELTNSQTGITDSYDVLEGETLTVEVTPNTAYSYFVDYQGEGSICTGEYRGQVMVPAGSAQTFNLAAATPTPEG